MKKTLSIIIPVFNEEKTIRQLLEKVNKVKLPNGIGKEIIVLDDYSTDNTAKILSKIKNVRFKYIRHEKNFGKGAAVRTGISKATGEYVIIQDGDLEYDPNDYIKLLQPVLKDKARVVYGSRLINYPLILWGENKTVLPVHLIANKLLTALTNLLYRGNLTDMETCYKLIKRNVIEMMTLRSNRFDFEPEITAKILKQNIAIIEVPIKVQPRTYKEGKKIQWTDGLIAVWTLLKYRFMD